MLVLWNSRRRSWMREAQPSCGRDLSLAGGITRGYCGGAGTTLRGSLCSPSRTQPRVGAGAPSSNTVSWRSGRYGRPYPWWPTTCPESPRFAFSFLTRRCPFLVLLQSMTPCSASPGAQDPVPWEVGLSPVGEGRLGPALAAGGPSRRCQRAPVGAERGGRGPPPSLCRREGRGGHGPDAARPSGGAGQGVGGGAHPRGQRSGCLQGLSH